MIPIEVSRWITSKEVEDKDFQSLVKTYIQQHQLREVATTQKVKLHLSSWVNLTGADLNAMAELLHMSERTLSRKLKAEGTVYKKLLDKERHVRCLFYIGLGITCGSIWVFLMWLTFINYLTGGLE